MKRDFPLNIFRNNWNTFRRISVFLVFTGMFRKSLDEIHETVTFSVEGFFSNDVKWYTIVLCQSFCLSRGWGTPFGENVSPVFPRKAFFIFVAFEQYIDCFVVKCVGTEKEQNYTHTHIYDNAQFSGYRDVFDWLLFARENSKPSNNH